MMGYSHVVLTGTAWLAAAPPICAALGHPMTLPEILASTTCAAAAALWPDWDHKDATLAQSLGPLSGALARLVHQAAGGHRRGTHTLLTSIAIGGATGLLWLVPDTINGFHLPEHWAVLALVFFLAYTLMRTLRLAISRSTWLGEGIYLAQAAAATVAVQRFVPGTWWWLPVAVGIGCLLHCLQDALTAEALPWFWRPFSRRPLHLPVTGPTGGVAEIVISLVLGVGLGAWILYATLSGNPWWSVTWLR